MRGKHAAVQNRIRNINPRAFFIPCAAHSLNLVVNDALKVSTEIINFFSLVQEFYNFCSASTKRWDVLKNHITHLTLKPLSETRWESRVNALRPLRYHIGEIYDALYEMSNDLQQDAFTKCKAESLASKIKDFRFLCLVVLWYDVLLKVNGPSKLLQP